MKELRKQDLVEEVFGKMNVYVKPKDIINLGFSKSEVYVWFNRSDFPLIRNGKALLAKKVEVEAWMENRGLI